MNHIICFTFRKYVQYILVIHECVLFIKSDSVYIIQLLLSWFGFYLQYCISYYYL